MSNVPEELPGLHEVSHNLHIEDPRYFLEQVPTLIAQLRLRSLTLTRSLDLSPNSLDSLDQHLAAVVDGILSRGLQVAQAIDRSLVHEIVAYVGQVVVLNKHGQWHISDDKNHFGPLVVFSASLSNKPFNKALDIGFHVLTVLLEGESLSLWYGEEIDSST